MLWFKKYHQRKIRKHEKSTGKDTTETRCYISSLDLNAAQTLHAIRSHWQVESMHWLVNMAFRADQFCIRKNNSHSLLIPCEK
jgi:predicted transposase YbfD/YdcC